MVKNTLAFKVLAKKKASVKMNDLYPKAKLLIEKIRNEVTALEENLEFFNEEHGVSDDNIQALESMLDQLKTLNGRSE